MVLIFMVIGVGKGTVTEQSLATARCVGLIDRTLHGRGGPVHGQAEEIFKDVNRLEDRPQRLVEQLDDFYKRGAHRLARTSADRHLVLELDGFMRAVEQGLEAFVREAVKDKALPDTSFQLLLALTDFPVWALMQRIGGEDRDRQRLLTGLLGCATRLKG